MRHVVSISLSEETLINLREKLRHNSMFRNKSHFVEYVINNYLNKTED